MWARRAAPAPLPSGIPREMQTYAPGTAIEVFSREHSGHIFFNARWDSSKKASICFVWPDEVAGNRW
jgi:hypothetical protein